MPRVAKKKPLRGSVRQNTARAPAEEAPRFTLGFGARLALLVLGTIAVIVFAAWLWHSDWPRRQVRALADFSLRSTQTAGFRIADVLVEGRHYTDKAALFGALGIRAGDPILSFDPVVAHEKIMALPWTESVSIIRSLPNKIVIRLSERQPIARWQHDDKTVVIDAEGRDIPAARPEQFASLPLVVGNAAPEQTQNLLAQLRDFPTVARVLKAAVRVGERRWNFYIQPNLLIRLPEHDMPAALTKLTQLIEEQKILDRNIAAIDLRLPDRMAIEPGTQPAAPQYGEKSE